MRGFLKAFFQRYVSEIVVLGLCIGGLVLSLYQPSDRIRNDGHREVFLPPVGGSGTVVSGNFSNAGWKHFPEHCPLCEEQGVAAE